VIFGAIGGQQYQPVRAYPLFSGFAEGSGDHLPGEPFGKLVTVMRTGVLPALSGGDEIPEFIEFQNKYKDKGLVVIGVSTDKDGWKVVKPFVQEKRINYTVLLGDDEICKRYGVEAMPVTLLIDREGRIAASHEGVKNKAAGEREIKTLVEERAKNAEK
jgi:AhpC/TSA family